MLLGARWQSSSQSASVKRPMLQESTLQWVTVGRRLPLDLIKDHRAIKETVQALSVNVWTCRRVVCLLLAATG